MLQARRSWVRFTMRSLDLSIDLILPAALGPGAKERSALKADNLTADCLEKMWEPRRLTILWASAACYRESFTFFYYIKCD
jgi:hypothetical protein